MKKIMMVVFGIILGVVVIGSFIGCETIEGGEALSVSPSVVALGESNGVRSVTFTVGGGNANTNGLTTIVGSIGDLSVPLTWSVSQPTLGHITTTAGNQAVYVSSGGKGVNVIKVKDQYGAEGLATVTQL